MKKPVLLILLRGALLLYLAPGALAGWGTLQRITWTADSSNVPAMARSANEAIHVVWQDLTPGNWEIYYRRSPDGGVTWNAIKRLTWTAGDSFSPAMAISANEAIHVVWQDLTPGNYEIYYKKSPDGGTTWNPVKRLTWTSGSSSSPSIAIDAADMIHVAWCDDTPGNLEVYYKKSSDGGATWSAAQRLTASSGSSITPAMVIDSNKLIHIAWCDDTPGNPEVYCSRSSNGGATWSAAQRLTWTSGKSYTPAMAIDSGEIIHLAWEDDTPGNYEIYHKRSTDGGATWSAARQLTSTPLESFSPAMAVDSSDTVHIAWSDYTPGNPEIYYLRSPDRGQTWSSAQRLTWTSSDSFFPAVVIDSSKIVHVVWEDFTPGNYEIYYKKGN